MRTSIVLAVVVVASLVTAQGQTDAAARSIPVGSVFQGGNKRPGPITGRPVRPGQNADQAKTRAGGSMPASSDAPRFLYGSAKWGKLYMPPKGPMGLVWYNPPGCRVVACRAMHESVVVWKETIPAHRSSSPVRIFRSKKLADKLRAWGRPTDGGNIEFHLTYRTTGRSKKVKEIMEAFQFVTMEEESPVDRAFGRWYRAKRTDKTPLLQDYWLELEKLGCGMECSVPLFDWWHRHPGDDATNAAMYSLAMRSECKPLQTWFLRRMKKK